MLGTAIFLRLSSCLPASASTVTFSLIDTAAEGPLGDCVAAEVELGDNDAVCCGLLGGLGSYEADDVDCCAFVGVNEVERVDSGRPTYLGGRGENIYLLTERRDARSLSVSGFKSSS